MQRTLKFIYKINFYVQIIIFIGCTHGILIFKGSFI